MSLEEQSPEEAAEQALTEAGYDEIEITGTRRAQVSGKPFARAWMVTATVRDQDGMRCEVDIPVGEAFGGLKGIIAQMRKREIN
jgi:hypothetical protein